VDSNRINARKLRSEKKYLEALPLYKNLWVGYKGVKLDCWLAWEYADTLKRSGMIDEAIDICKKVYEIDKVFKYNLDLLAWCLYEKYIKSINVDNPPKDIEKTIRIANFITQISKQESGSPYEYTVWTMIKTLKNRAAVNYSDIDFWLMKLNADLLSDISYVVTDKTGKQRELASKKEDWYITKCKILYRTNKYEECLEFCNKSLSIISTFHYDNDIWLNTKKAYCMGVLGEKENAVQMLKSLLVRKEHWSINDMIFRLQVELGEHKSGLFYAYKAALSKDPLRGKVNLFLRIGEVLETLNSKDYALKHYMLCKKIREEEGWKVSGRLDESIASIEGGTGKYSDGDIYRELKMYWTEQKLSFTERSTGVITSLLPTGKAGFLKCENNSFYFQLSSVINRHKLKINKKVEFSLIDSFDKKKNKETKQAVDILVLEN
jgi:tetratricopeptide (TPR) repeat protein